MVGRFSHSSKNHIHRRFRSSIPYRSVGGSWENEKAGAGEVGLGRSTSAHDDSIDGFNLAGQNDLAAAIALKGQLFIVESPRMLHYVSIFAGGKLQVDFRRPGYKVPHKFWHKKGTSVLASTWRISPSSKALVLIFQHFTLPRGKKGESQQGLSRNVFPARSTVNPLPSISSSAAGFCLENHFAD
ncbi:hypothetical protein MRB53_017184 [Persea americana]|uniref:Uncharacterized protein n=1 Tax=Persea americana TaxID=3435 RepID=A0ACC2M4C3_PERAE|nr:hypothetical protein MRB53_036456 [Persea americana]KAJ8614865.1 hypothetical protein MRB53_036278 [Persea americana]KAJ8640490.1 hypothetical protein MRB53_017184 [Persea americana]